jgi:hypothetical protein
MFEQVISVQSATNLTYKKKRPERDPKLVAFDEMIDRVKKSKDLYETRT